MKIQKSLQLALNILRHSKLRSWLTIIGIIIGIAAVVSIVSISDGAQRSMEEQFGSLGADIITVTPGYSKAVRFGPHKADNGGGSAGQDDLTNKDVLAIKSVNNVKYVMGVVSSTAEISYLGDKGNVNVQGVDTSVWKDLVSNELKEGRYLTKSDSYSVILGHKRAMTYFENEVQLNRQVVIEGKLFKVVGIFEEGEDDNAVIIPITIARNLFDDIDDKEYHFINAKLDNVDLFEDTISDIEKKLMLTRGILKSEDRDFTVSSIKELMATISQTLDMMALFLGAIAAISLIVGAVGISNTMFTSVLEKTKEIGIMKAIGAKNKDVLLIFLFNSGMIGLVGGIGGVLLGMGVSGLINVMNSGATSGGGGMNLFGSTYVSVELMLFAFLFSVIIGMIAGVIPAYKASKLKPVDALRYQ